MRNKRCETIDAKQREALYGAWVTSNCCQAPVAQCTCNSRLLCFSSLFLFAPSFRAFSPPFYRVSRTPTFLSQPFSSRFAAAFAKSTRCTVRSCVLSSNVSNPSHCACYACSTLPLFLILIAPFVRVCSRRSMQHHARFDTLVLFRSFTQRDYRRISHSTTRRMEKRSAVRGLRSIAQSVLQRI